MGNSWKVVEGTGWLELLGFGRINPRQDNVGGGRQYFTAKTEDGGFAMARGDHISGGPETWYFEFEEPFFLADRRQQVVEVVISPLVGGRYRVRFRTGEWPNKAIGGWAMD